MCAALDGVGPRVLIGAEALAGGTEQGQQHHGSGVEQEQQPLTALRIAYASRTHPPGETQIFGVPEARLDAPALGVTLDQGPGVSLRVAGGRPPRRLHALGVHTHEDTRIIPVCRDPRMAQCCGAISRPTQSAEEWRLPLASVTLSLLRKRMTSSKP